jgi:hypothetical protein
VAAVQRALVHSLRTATAAAACAFLVGACGSSSNSSSTLVVPVDAHTRAYLASVCAATQPSVTDFRLFATALARAKASDLRQYKRNVVQLLTTMASHAAHAVRGLRTAGAPDFKNGAAFARAVLAQYAAFHRALERGLVWARGISTVNGYQFGLAFGGLQALLGQGLSAAGNPVKPFAAELHSPSVAAAQRTIPACQRAKI